MKKILTFLSVIIYYIVKIIKLQIYNFYFCFLLECLSVLRFATLTANSRIHAIKVLLTSKNTGIGACLLRFIGNGLDCYCELGVNWIGTKHEIASG